MVVKCLRELYRRDAEGIPTRIAFITHSEALATEVVEGMMSSLDPSHRWERLKHATLWRGSLYQLARDLLDYQKKDLRPLSLDGVEGRELQKMLLSDAIKASLTNSRFIKDILAICSLEFRSLLERPEHRSRLLELLLNEFASVLDADGIRRGTDQARRYLTAYRDEWLMALSSVAEREAVLFIHDIYSSMLDKSQYLSMDQMIGDLSRYLMNSAELACTRFRRHQVRCFNGTGGASWSVGSLHGSLSLKLCA